MKKIKVFYTEKQTASGNSSFSPSAGKPSEAVSQWTENFGSSIEIVEPVKLEIRDLALAHEKAYVVNVLRQIEPNGFGNTIKEVAKALPWTSSSFYSAALEVVRNGGVAVSPTSGFHHACYNRGGGFCTFNGLMVTAIKLQKEEGVKKVGILDLDEHYGNGTDHIIEKLDIDYISHYTSGAHGFSNAKAEEFLADFPNLLEEYFGNVDVLLYQAGADCHVDDPLGGWLTSGQMRRRDQLVFEFCKAKNIPIAWNLAGGYQVDSDGSIQKVLDIHNVTMEECLKVYTK